MKTQGFDIIQDQPNNKVDEKIAEQKQKIHALQTERITLFDQCRNMQTKLDAIKGIF